MIMRAILFLKRSLGFLAFGLAALGVASQSVQAARKASPSSMESPAGLHRPLGMGLVFGEPTGFSFKYLLPENRAIDGGLAFSLRSFFMIWSDYLFHFPGAFGASSDFVSQLKPYVGGGAVLFFSTKSGRTDRALYTDSGNSVAFGLRVPFGIEWMVPRAPVGIYVELVPGVGIIPSTFAFLQGGVGGRFYF
jgi:hypothetical protein